MMLKIEASTIRSCSCVVDNTGGCGGGIVLLQSCHVMDGIVRVKEAFLTQNLRLNRKSLMLKIP